MNNTPWWIVIMVTLAAVCLFVAYCDDIANGTPEEREALKNKTNNT